MAKIAKIFFIPNIVYVLISALVLRILLSSFGTLQLDQGTFVAWSMDLATNGFKNFYEAWSDYLPGYLYILYGLGKINLLNLIPQEILYKLPAILADVVTGLLIYKILIKSKNEKWALIGASIYLFNPAIFGNSSLWGQVDSLTALLSAFTIYQFSFNIYLSAIALAVGTLIKPQAAFIFPVVLFMFWQNKKKLSDLLTYCVIGLLVFTLGFIPFWNHSNLFQFIFERLALSSSQYVYTSVNAFNFWGITGFWRPDTYQWIVGIFITILIFIFSLRKIKSPYLLSGIILVSSFVFMTRMHERHFLPALVFLAISAIENPKLLIPYVGFSITYSLNLYYAYVWITEDFKNVFSDSLLKLFSFMNVVFLGLSLFPIKLALKIKAIKSEIVKMPKVGLNPKYYKNILWGILLFATVTRFYNLGSPTNEYFDEVYHAFTAKVMLHSDNFKAWEWWNTPPEGFAYEWTHPPLAKIGMAMGMIIFGENSFGYRFFGAVLGIGIIYLIYLLAKEIFKDEIVALLSAGVYSLDGLALVMSRIGMNDNYILFFSLLSIYLFMKNKNLGSAIAFGLALSSKWSAIWSIPILFVLWLRRENKFTQHQMVVLGLSFTILPIIIYILSYLQMFTTGHTLTTWWDMQKQMWWYHTGLVAEHPYTSLWWTWPLLLRPIYLYTSDEVMGMVSRIYAFGNPVIFWFGLVSVFTSLYYAFKEKNKEIALIVFSYFIFFVPWAMSPRIMFFYHYLPSIPFLAIATGYVLRRNPKLIFIFLAFAFLAFVYFYPHYAGLKIPIWLDTSYYWLDSWR